MKYAIIALQGKQYRVEEGQELIVDRLEGEKGAAVKIAEVLLFADGDNVLVGSPLVKDIAIKATLSEHQKGDKIRVSTYKAKSRERKTHGHRQAESVIKIVSIAAA